jgi:signal transduction histidine kinase/CheY-like chemotaxis protein
VTGALVVAPVLVLWAKSARFDERRELLEPAALFVAAGVVGLVALGPFSEQTAHRGALDFLAVLPLLWSALRRGPRDTATVALILSCFAVWGASADGGSLARATLNESFLVLATFLISAAVPSLALSADVAMRKRTERQLREVQKELDQKVEQRTAELETANRRLLAEIEEREQAEAQLLQAQRIEAVGQLTSGVAHDFNNLLTAVLGNLELLEKARPGDPRSPRRIAAIRAAAERGARLTGQLLAFSRKQRLEPRPVDLNRIVTGIGDLLRSTIGGAIRIEPILGADLWPALADPNQIELVLLNLAINARDALEVGGSLTIETTNVALGAPARPEEPPAGDYVMVSVTDSGAGMSEEVRAKAFEPFFTTKEPGKGSGLGLSMVYGVAKQLGGGVRIDTRLGEGTSVKVYLPRAIAVVETPSAVRGDPAVAAAAAATLLLVDDDADVRAVTASMLEELGYHVIEAANGGAALDRLDRESGIDLLLVDFAMPAMNGIEVARQARTRRPGLPIMFITGYSDTAALAGEAGEAGIIQKPFRSGDLAAKVACALNLATYPTKICPNRRRSSNGVSIA